MTTLLMCSAVSMKVHVRAYPKVKGLAMFQFSLNLLILNPVCWCIQEHKQIQGMGLMRGRRRFWRARAVVHFVFCCTLSTLQLHWLRLFKIGYAGLKMAIYQYLCTDYTCLCLCLFSYLWPLWSQKFSPAELISSQFCGGGMFFWVHWE